MFSFSNIVNCYWHREYWKDTLRAVGLVGIATMLCRQRNDSCFTVLATIMYHIRNLQVSNQLQNKHTKAHAYQHSKI